MKQWLNVRHFVFSSDEPSFRAHVQTFSIQRCTCAILCFAAANLIFVLAMMTWVGGLAILFGGIKYTLGLRINNTMEGVRGTLMYYCKSEQNSQSSANQPVTKNHALYTKYIRNCREKTHFRIHIAETVRICGQ